MRLSVEPVEVRLREPMVSARGTIEERELLLVRLEDSEGFIGVGEAAPLESYDGVTLSDVRAALEDCRPVLEHGDRVLREDLLAGCAGAAVLPQAIAAIDMALWDLEGRRTGDPVWQLLGAGEAPAIAVNATIASADRAGAASAAAEAREQGFGCLKVKVGLGDDAGRLAAVRATAGPRMLIRVDANGAWEVDEALAALQMLAPSAIELCEEPCSGLDAIAEVSAASPIPIAVDESVRLPGALDDPACDAACLKITRAGGITGLLADARRARRSGYSIYIASTLDGPLGIAAALHAAAAVGPEHACGLATLAIFADRPDPMPPHRGRMSPPAGAGLGEGLLSWYQPRG